MPLEIDELVAFGESEIAPVRSMNAKPMIQETLIQANKVHSLNGEYMRWNDYKPFVEGLFHPNRF